MHASWLPFGRLVRLEPISTLGIFWNPLFIFKLHVPIIYFNFQYREAFVPQVGLVYVRGCEVEGMLDHLGRIIEEGPDPRPKIPGGQRTFRVW